MLSSPHACCPSLVLAVGEGRNLSADKKEVVDYGINPSLKDGEFLPMSAVTGQGETVLN